MTEQLLTLPSCAKSVYQIEEFVNMLVDNYNICQEKFPDILISLTEAVNNAIIHGNKNDESKLVKINMIKSQCTIVFKVSDEGEGFDPDSVPDPTQPDKLCCCGGRGVFLMRQLSDDLHYHDNGRTVEICFHLNDQAH